MALSKIKELTQGICTAKIYFNSALQEYVCKFYKAGVHLTGADYFTDDRADAVGTAQWQVGLVKNTERYYALLHASTG